MELGWLRPLLHSPTARKEVSHSVLTPLADIQTRMFIKQINPGLASYNNNISVLSFPSFPLDGEDSEDLERSRARRWREPGSMNDCLEQRSLSFTDLLWTYDMSNKQTLLALSV